MRTAEKKTVGADIFPAMGALEIYQELLRAYGAPRWWSDDPYTVMFQAILVQNTSWKSVEKVTQSMGSQLCPDAVAQLSQEALEDLIRPCGFCRSKASAIRDLTHLFSEYQYNVECINARYTAPELRQVLLHLKGIGEETADVLLVFAFNRASFIVDAYTRRFLRRLGYVFSGDDAIRSFFEAGLPQDYKIYGWTHWLILDHGIQHCKKTPACEGCPFRDDRGDGRPCPRREGP